MKKYIKFFLFMNLVMIISFINSMEEIEIEPTKQEQIRNENENLGIINNFLDLPAELQDYVLISVIKDTVDSSENIFEAHTKFSKLLKNIMLVNREFRRELRPNLSYFRNKFFQFMEEKFGKFMRGNKEELSKEVGKIFNIPKGLLDRSKEEKESFHKENEEKAGRLILAGASVDTTVGNYYDSILKKAAGLDYEKLVKLLLERDAEIDAINALGYTALYDAVEGKNHSIAKLLLDKGANPKIKFSFGRTVLMEAADKNDEKMVDLLLEHGADITAKNLEGFTAYLIAKRNGNKELAKKLKPQGKITNALKRAKEWIID